MDGTACFKTQVAHRRSKICEQYTKEPCESQYPPRPEACMLIHFQSGKILRKLLRDQAREEIEKATVKAKL